MTEQHGESADGVRYEIGLDGKPYEVWSPPPADAGPPAALSATMPPPGYIPVPRGAAETAVLMTPRTSMELNHFAWYSLGLGTFALSVQVIGWFAREDLVVGRRGMPWIVAFGFAAAGFYFGMRSHNASLRGFCTNGGLGRAGIVVSVSAALVTVAIMVRFIAEIGRVASGA